MAVRAVLKQPCSTGGWTGTVRPKHLPPGRTGLSDQFLGPVAQDQPGPVGQICPTSWLLLRSDSARLTTDQTRLLEHRSNCRVRLPSGKVYLLAKRVPAQRAGVPARQADTSPAGRCTCSPSWYQASGQVYLLAKLVPGQRAGLPSCRAGTRPAGRCTCSPSWHQPRR
ncbi:hypothetical protein PCASD_26415 [Puccinia coronata f. sp. avenae]|uniref:Uncharacterized protein n=1 Tax=Puccinia coronata f. sp. avenae TaxID=200324 RepID=A0A2N5S2B3_9BASI|nr:hypothetical protein PCASD_26415 [Puccinia coronata f. sp. avenae]